MHSSHYGIEAFRRKGPSWWRCGASKLSEGRGRCRAGGRPEGRGVRWLAGSVSVAVCAERSWDGMRVEGRVSSK